MKDKVTEARNFGFRAESRNCTCDGTLQTGVSIECEFLNVGGCNATNDEDWCADVSTSYTMSGLEGIRDDIQNGIPFEVSMSSGACVDFSQVPDLDVDLPEYCVNFDFVVDHTGEGGRG